MRSSIERQLREALEKNPLTRNRLVINILNADMKKCIMILLKKNKKRVRLYDVDDLIQESCISIINVLNNNHLSEVKCEVRTYLIGTVKRTVWGILREESRIKRQAQNMALPLELLENPNRHTSNVEKFKVSQGAQDIVHQVVLADDIERIKNKLAYPAKDIFMDLLDGYTIKEVSERCGIKLQSVYTIMRRKIKPVAKRILAKVE